MANTGNKKPATANPYKAAKVKGQWVVLWYIGAGQWAVSGNETYATKQLAQAAVNEKVAVSHRAVRAQSACLKGC